MEKKSVVILGLVAAMAASSVMAGCGNKGTDNGTSAAAEGGSSESLPSGEITVCSREAQEEHLLNCSA